VRPSRHNIERQTDSVSGGLLSSLAEMPSPSIVAISSKLEIKVSISLPAVLGSRSPGVFRCQHWWASIELLCHQRLGLWWPVIRDSFTPGGLILDV
jgi:hypothetical protein